MTSKLISVHHKSEPGSRQVVAQTERQSKISLGFMRSKFDVRVVGPGTHFVAFGFPPETASDVWPGGGRGQRQRVLQYAKKDDAIPICGNKKCTTRPLSDFVAPRRGKRKSFAPKWMLLSALLRYY